MTEEKLIASGKSGEVLFILWVIACLVGWLILALATSYI
jgi:hypothetical protein